MSTVAPIDVERYLLQGESGEEDLLGAAGLKRKPGAPPVKPPLEDALLNSYNKSAPTPLAPGQLPEPVPLAPETIQAGKTTLQKAGEIATRIPGQIYESLPSFGGGAPTTTPQAPTVAAPAPQREYSSGLYGTLQRSANFVRDISEFGGKTLAGMGAFTFGAATAVSDILNAQLARVAGGGPMAGGPESSTHYRDIFTRMDKTISDLTPEPRSDTAKTLSKGVGAVTSFIKDIAELPGKGLVAAGILNEDTARVLSFGAELYLFYKIDRAVRQAAPELRSKIAEFKTRMSRAKTDSEVADIANDLADAASKNPRLEAALDEARGKFRDEADREAGAAGPREPSPEGGPAGGGAEVELVYDPAELQAYRDALQRASDQFDVLNPEGASIWERRDYLEKNVPKPQGRPKEPTPPAEAPRAQPQAAPTLEAQRAAPTMERPVQPEVVVGQETAVSRPIPEAPTPPAVEPVRPAAEVRPVQQFQTARGSEYTMHADGTTSRNKAARPEHPGDFGPQPKSEATFFLSEMDANKLSIMQATNPYKFAVEQLPDGRYGVRVKEGPDAGRFIRGTIVTPTNEPTIGMLPIELWKNGEIVHFGNEVTRLGPPTTQAPITTPTPAPVTPVAAAATVAPETVPAPVSPEIPAVAAVPSSPARELFNAANAPGVASSERNSALAQLKLLAREGLRPNESIRPGLERLGFTADEIGVLEAQLRKVRAAKAGAKTLQEIAEMRGRTTLVPGIPNDVYEFLAREGNATVSAISRRAGLTYPEVNEAIRQLKSEGRIEEVQAGNYTHYRAKPAVQTAATEAVLENAPAGAEVEIPAPSEPVVDSTPVIEKPKRKRRVVKANTEEQITRESEAEEIVSEMRAARVALEGQLELVKDMLRSAGLDPIKTLESMRDAFNSGIRPLQVRENFIERGIPEDIATRIANLAYNMHVRGESITGELPTGKETYRTVRDVSTLERQIQESTPILGAAEPAVTPVQLRLDASSGKPNAIFIDTAGMNTLTSVADIQAQLARGRMSEDTATMLRVNLARQAQIYGVPIEQAHRYTGQELTREATNIAADNNLDLYVKKGKNYELVPKDVVRTDARLNRGDDLAPTPISAEAAGAYVESKTSDIGPAQIREIMAAVERGEDITNRLPSELVPHYQAMRESERAGIDTSERRAFIDILNDMNTLLGEEGSIGWRDFTRAQRMAAQRLQADMRKAGKTVREFLFGARPEDVAMFESYLDRINNPVPPDSTNPRNMRFDPENVIRGDRVVKHRVISSTKHLEAPPLWNSEVKGLQGARDIKPGGTEWDLKAPIRQHKAAGTEFLYYAYRTAQKNLNAELSVLNSDMQEIARGFSSRSLENIGANGYARQGGDGQRILTYNKVTPRPLTTPERQLQSRLDEIYAAFETRLNEVREATGREPLAHVDNYQTFARTINVLNHLGIKVDLARDSTADIHAKYIKHRATNFPYVVRKHAFYTAEMNALKILDTYAQAALKDIHMSPFLAKMNELTDTLLPDPATGKETWALQDHKPGLYKELRRWTDFLATGTNVEIPNNVRMVLNTINKNVAYATLSGLVRSGGIQLSTLVNTSQALGMTNTLKSAVEILSGHLAHPFSGGTARDFAIRNSEILSSRKFIDGYNEAAAAFIGRRPRDIAHAVRVGDWGSIQQAVGQPGFKLLELFDMEAAVITWNAAYKIAKGSKMGYSHKDSVRYADDLVVRTQGSTMPGDLVGFQRNARGKLITQFQTFLISDFNFLRDEVLSKGKSGGGGGGNIPPGGVPSGTGSWETGGPRSKTQFGINVIRLLIYTQIMNELYKMMHIQPPLPDPVEDTRKSIKEGHSLPQLALDLAIGQAERLPFVGGMRYGKGVAGPAIETARDLARSYRSDPLSPPWWEPTATAVGVPGTRQISKTVRAVNRGENIWDSLMGWYSQERGGGRERGERRERRNR